MPGRERVPSPGEPRIGLVFSGGGAKGAFEAGVVAALEEAGIAPTVVAGTSAGALNAAAVAVGLDAAGLSDLWASLESRDVFRPRYDVHRLIDPRRLLRLGPLLDPDDHRLSDHLLESVGWTWLFDTSPLRHRLVELLGGEELPIEEGMTLSVPALDLRTGRLARFLSRPPSEQRTRDGDIVTTLTVDHLLASAATPLLFGPPRIDGALYWDGGLVANTPLRAALQFEPDVVFVLATGAAEIEADEPESFGQAISLVLDHLLRHALLEDLDHAQTVNKLVEAAPGATKHKFVDLQLITPAPTSPTVGAFLDFEPSRSRKRIAEGYDAAMGVIDAWLHTGARAPTVSDS